MRFFLRSDPKCDQRFAILIPEDNLIPVGIEDKRWNVDDLEDMLRHIVWYQSAVARKEILKHPVIQWIQGTGSKVTRISKKRYRVRRFEGVPNGLVYNQLLLGVSFRFPDRGRAAAFKLAWGNNASPDLIAYRTKPAARKPFAFAA